MFFLNDFPQKEIVMYVLVGNHKDKRERERRPDAAVCERVFVSYVISLPLMQSVFFLSPAEAPLSFIKSF
jgi:hypothetical protein